MAKELILCEHPVSQRTAPLKEGGKWGGCVICMDVGTVRAPHISCIHTHVHTLTYRHTHMHPPTQTYTHACTRTDTTHARMHTRMHTHTHKGSIVTDSTVLYNHSALMTIDVVDYSYQP